MKKPLQFLNPASKIQHPESSIQFGASGEDLAVQFLENKGWDIIERNWRCHFGELDIVAWDELRTLVFVEVKTRSSEQFGGPEGAVGKTKQSKLLRAAAAYMQSVGYEWIIRFDVIAIVFAKDKEVEIRHYEDAFFF
ncbi:MAG: YraN family protein [Saprospiraceae bacterium]|nr:YraN family protein [Saprospiraceae bacterium]